MTTRKRTAITSRRRTLAAKDVLQDAPQAEINMRAYMLQHGYAIVARITRAQLGDTIHIVNEDDESVVGPLVISGLANQYDWVDQCRAGGGSTYLDPRYKYFYKVVLLAEE